MTSDLLQRETSRTLGQHNPRRDWVVSHPKHCKHSLSADGLFQTKLLFSETMPTSFSNRATRIGPPSPIVIEKLMPRLEEPERPCSSRSSVNFTTVSEERLMAAVRLAKRDLQRRRQESLRSPSARTQLEESIHDTSRGDLAQENADSSAVFGPKTSSPKQKATRGTRLNDQSPQRTALAGFGHVKSPPTRDPGLGPSDRSHQPQLSREIQKVLKELLVYIEKVENGATEKKAEEPLEPEEQQKKVIHGQKQAAYSARIIYGLRQQVKDIQEDMEKSCSHRDHGTKMSKVVDRLAAAHRSALRAMRVFTEQLSEPPVGKVQSHHKELSQLLRQLALCAAKVEVDSGSTVPTTALEVLERLESLDSAFSKQERAQQRQAQTRSLNSPPRGRSPQQHMSTPFAPRGAPINRGLGRRRAVGPRKGAYGCRRAPPLPRVPRGAQHQDAGRRQVLRAGLESLLQQGALRAQSCERTEPQPRSGRRAVPHRQRSRSQPLRGDAGFRQPTVSSQLRVNQPPRKEPSVPWVPTSPHSPPRPAPQRSPPGGRPEPRCLFSPVKASPSPPRPREARGPGAEQLLLSDQRSRAQSEALRQAWLERTTIQRLRELNQLSREEADRITRLRSEVGSPTQWAQRAEQQARERIQPLLDEARQMDGPRRSTSPLPGRRGSEQAALRGAKSAGPPEDRLDETTPGATWAGLEEGCEDEEALRLVRAPTLESMLLRMEEIQKDQDEVRRRFAAITYSDPLSWSSIQPPGIQSQALGSRPASPQPIRLTRPVQRHSPVPRIVLEKPVEIGHSVLSESSLTAEEGEAAAAAASCSQGAPGLAGGAGGGPEGGRGRTAVTVPGGMLRNVRRYREGFDDYLRLVAHEPVGSFNPWAIADRLAEELLEEALADVAAEFQDACEDYAEAVFTSEFLQPVQSPPAPAPSVPESEPLGLAEA